jgi:hypothetical protein
MKRRLSYGVCECGVRFEKRSPKQKKCEDCSFWMQTQAYKLRSMNRAEIARLKADADASGNPRIFRREEYSQEFLASLIPGR